MTYAHLLEKTAEKTQESNEQRIRYIQAKKWIEYSHAALILKKLNHLLQPPILSLSTQNTPSNLLIIGDNNNGKTELINKFRQRHPVDDLQPKLKLPVLYLKASSNADVGQLYGDILHKLFEPYCHNESIENKCNRLIHLLRKIDLGMIVIDEVEYIRFAPHDQQKRYLDALYSLGKELSIPIVALGTSQVLSIFYTTALLPSLFNIVFLPRWQYNYEFLRLLTSFEMVLPLKEASHLIEPKLSKSIFIKTQGKIGEMILLLNKAAIYAIETGKEKIDISCISHTS
ncbi:TniB family NTP-binding protein [Neisseria sp. Ec49-e6-T10]|uniref:TniB family NTP-binding protein n=1 Tax=Neisseria sp. Ec49-e6-T10 TaxID=3140744 RepID=UPI003EBE66BE